MSGMVTVGRVRLGHADVRVDGELVGYVRRTVTFPNGRDRQGQVTWQAVDPHGHVLRATPFVLRRDAVAALTG